MEAGAFHPVPTNGSSSSSSSGGHMHAASSTCMSWKNPPLFETSKPYPVPAHSRAISGPALRIRNSAT
eukprot:350436-Chlamydomonas_euryale.AAC.19